MVPRLKVRGYASVFGNVDSYGEIVDGGAFTDWIKANPDTSVPLFWQHDHIDFWGGSDEQPIGKTTKIVEDDHGLYFEGEISPTLKAEQIAILLEHGAVNGASFAFNTIDQYEEDEAWHLAKLDLKEISAVNWGANDQAYIEIIPEGDPTDE